MPNKRLILKKLEEIMVNLELLEKLLKFSFDEMNEETERWYLAERIMERMIGAAIDVNMHILSGLKFQVPPSYKESFLLLAQAKVMPADFAKKIALSAGLRNIIAHEYMTMHYPTFYKSMKTALSEYKKYVQYLEKALDV